VINDNGEVVFPFHILASVGKNINLMAWIIAGKIWDISKRMKVEEFCNCC
jgi:hypothetical protein